MAPLPAGMLDIHTVIFCIWLALLDGPDPHKESHTILHSSGWTAPKAERATGGQRWLLLIKASPPIDRLLVARQTAEVHVSSGFYISLDCRNHKSVGVDDSLLCSAAITAASRRCSLLLTAAHCCSNLNSIIKAPLQETANHGRFLC
jgi:hypothetical protein